MRGYTYKNIGFVALRAKEDDFGSPVRIGKAISSSTSQEIKGKTINIH